MDHSPPGSSIHGIFQARVLEWGAMFLPGAALKKFLMTNPVPESYLFPSIQQEDALGLAHARFRRKNGSDPGTWGSSLCLPPLLTSRVEEPSA